MLPSDANIRLLKRNFDQLHELGQLETILPLLDAMKVSMTTQQFDLAMTQLTMSEDNRQVAYLFFVENKTVVQMDKQHGVSASRLSKVLKRVISNYEKQLNSHGLVSEEYLLDAATAKLVRDIEATTVGEAKIKPYYQSAAAKNKAKKNLDQRPAKKAGKKSTRAAIGKTNKKATAKSITKATTKINSKAKSTTSKKTKK